MLWWQEGLEMVGMFAPASLSVFGSSSWFTWLLSVMLASFHTRWDTSLSLAMPDYKVDSSHCCQKVLGFHLPCLYDRNLCQDDRPEATVSLHIGAGYVEASLLSAVQDAAESRGWKAAETASEVSTTCCSGGSALKLLCFTVCRCQDCVHQYFIWWPVDIHKKHASGT